MNPSESIVEYIVREVVDLPDTVKVTKTVDDMGTLLTVTVAKSEMGKLVGKNGDTINALRKIMHVIGMKTKERLSVKVENV